MYVKLELFKNYILNTFPGLGKKGVISKNMFDQVIKRKTNAECEVTKIRLFLMF
jgi:hypothetical protein